jgi:hypothetical protein
LAEIDLRRRLPHDPGCGAAGIGHRVTGIQLPGRHKRSGATGGMPKDFITPFKSLPQSANAFKNFAESTRIVAGRTS